MITPETIGRYQIRRELGRGGMAIVYVAYDPRFEREVALKILPGYFVHEEDFRARFEREAKTLARLEHFAIVPVYDYGQDGSPYLVMRYMRGGTLKDRMKKGPIPLDEAIKIVQRVGAALDATHDIGIIHRDLKPDNILFDEMGRAYLSDFGIVKLAEGSQTFTKTGGIIGTPAYMSPEQATGAKGVDRRSDIYSLGVILYEMLAGKAPFEADTTVRLIMKHVSEPVPDILKENPALPPACDAIIKRVMAKQPEERFGSCAELVDALNRVRDGMVPPIVTRPPQDVAATRIEEQPETSPWPESGSRGAGGATFARTAPIHSTPAPRQESAVPQSTVAPPKDGGRLPFIWLLALGAFGLLAILLIGGYFIFDRFQQDTASATSVTETSSAAAMENTRQAAEISIQATSNHVTQIAAAATSSSEQTVVAAEGAASETATYQALVAAAATATEAARPTPTPQATPLGGGERIVFDSNRDGNREIFVMNVDGSSLTQLTFGEADNGDPVFSPDNSKILFGSLADGDWELYTMDPDGSNIVQLTHNNNIDWAGKWSPDGSKIVFVSDRDGNQEIYVMDADGSNQIRLTNNAVIDAFPNWSPDGQTIIFESVVSEGGRDFFLVNADGSNLRRLMENSDFDRNASFSPDGLRIVFTSNRMSDDEIFVMDSDGSNVIRLTNSPGQDFAPKWSPDGKRITFVSERDGNREIYTMNMDGSNQVNLTNHPDDDSFPNWMNN